MSALSIGGRSCGGPKYCVDSMPGSVRGGTEPRIGLAHVASSPRRADGAAMLWVSEDLDEPALGLLTDIIVMSNGALGYEVRSEASLTEFGRQMAGH